jgi:hypothetical protein
VIKTNEPVTQKFVATLNEIRIAATDCDFVLPRPGGEPLDATRMSVRISGPQGVFNLERLQSLGDCGLALGGFVFDKAPGGPEPPARVQLCPATCDLLHSDDRLAIEVVVDCVPDAG